MEISADFLLDEIKKGPRGGGDWELMVEVDSLASSGDITTATRAQHE